MRAVLELALALAAPLLAQTRAPSPAIVPIAPVVTVGELARSVAPMSLGLAGAAALSLPVPLALQAPVSVAGPVLAAVRAEGGALAGRSPAVPALVGATGSAGLARPPVAARAQLALARGLVAGPLAVSRSAWVRFFDGAGRAAEPVVAPPSVPLGPVFSADAKISERLVAAIDGSKTRVELALHGLSLPKVAEALGRAKARGVRVRLVMNRSHVHPEKASQSRSPEVQYLIDQGFELRTLRGGGPYGSMHNKFAVFDGRLLVTGSFNWSRAADERNYENALFTDDAHRLGGYAAYWGWLWERSAPAGAEQAPARPEPPPSDPARPVRFRQEAFPAYAFSPRGGVEGWLARAVELSRRSIDLAMFSFTSEALEEALVAAKARGVKVRIVFDRSQARGLESMRRMAQLGFEVKLSEGRGPRGRERLAALVGRGPDNGVFHHKFAVFDGELLETGSYNWTGNAERNNFENANFYGPGSEADAYAREFEKRWKSAARPTEDDLSQPSALPEGFEIH